MTWAWALACTGAPAPVPVGMPHFSEWRPLLTAVSRGDVGAAQVLARDLGEGDVEGAALTSVGGALGMFVVAEDEDELRDALAALVRGCAGCHVARPLPSVPFEHRTALVHVAEAAVSGRALGVPADAFARAAGASDGVAAAAATCAPCHRRAP